MDIHNQLHSVAIYFRKLDSLGDYHVFFIMRDFLSCVKYLWAYICMYSHKRVFTELFVKLYFVHNYVEKGFPIMWIRNNSNSTNLVWVISDFTSIGEFSYCKITYIYIHNYLYFKFNQTILIWKNNNLLFILFHSMKVYIGIHIQSEK